MTLTEEQAWNNVRAGRDYWLEKSVDFYQSKPLLYNSLTDEQRTELGEYRQALLDFPQDLETYLDGDMPLDYDLYFPVQPECFEHRQHTEETQTAMTT